MKELNETKYLVSTETDLLISLQADVERLRIEAHGVFERLGTEFVKGEDIEEASEAFEQLQTALSSMTASSVKYNIGGVSADKDKKFFI